MSHQTDIALLNAVANEPEVLSYMAPGHQNIDLSGFFDNPGNIMFGDEHGLVIFGYHGDGVYEGHYLITSSLSRRDMLRLCRRALAALFTLHGASVIKGATPRGNLAARAVNRALGFRPCGTTTDAAGRPCITYILEREQWVHLSAASSAA